MFSDWCVQASPELLDFVKTVLMSHVVYFKRLFSASAPFNSSLDELE